MGTPVGRIEQEFVLKSLIESETRLDVHGTRKDVHGTLVRARQDTMELADLEGPLDSLEPGETVRVYFSFRNMHHTFNASVVNMEDEHLVISFPPSVYKNLKRKYERIRMPEGIEVYFSIKGAHVELSFPKTEKFRQIEKPQEPLNLDTTKMKEVIQSYRNRMSEFVSENNIEMLRDRMPRSYEEKMIVVLGKTLWIPSTEEDFPLKDPYPEERVITKNELYKYEESQGTASRIIVSKLGNYLYEKTKQDIYSELYCPLVYRQYVAGYVHLKNDFRRREKISRQILDYTYQFSKVLCHLLEADGYFSTEESGEKRYQAPIVDMSASGLLFAHTSEEIARSLPQHADLDIMVRVKGRKIVIGSRIMRRFKNADTSYFGVQFLDIEQEDFGFLYEYLYGKPFRPEYGNLWEGGAAAPELQL